MDKAFVFTSFSVDDLARAKDFYVDKLGFELGAPVEDDALKITKGGQRYHVYPKPNHSPASFTVINLKVDNIEAAVDELTAKGVKFEHYDNEYITTDAKGIADDGHGRQMAWFTDPAGNIHGLLQS